MKKNKGNPQVKSTLQLEGAPSDVSGLLIFEVQLITSTEAKNKQDEKEERKDIKVWNMEHPRLDTKAKQVVNELNKMKLLYIEKHKEK